MGLSARERVGSRRLLELLDTADLLSLADTVIKKKSTVFSRAGAIDTILQNSQSAYELLNRKKVLRDIIAAYLKNEGIPISPKITKAELVQKTLAYWRVLVSNIPYAETFITSSITQQPKSAASTFSHPFYFHTSISSISSPLEDAGQTWKLGAPTADLDEIIRAVNFIQVKDPVTSRSITKQDKVSDVSVWQQQKIPSDVSSCPFSSDISKMSTRSCQEDRKELRPTSQTQGPQSDVSHRISSSKSVTYPLRVVNKGYTVTEGGKGKPQKSQSSPVNEFVPHMTTRSMLQTERQPANVQARTEKVAATPYTGVTQENKKVSQPPNVQQAAHNKRKTKVVTSLFSATEEDGDTSCIWPVDCKKFTSDFCEWFYTLLNSQHSSQKKDWGPQHFLENAVLQLTYMSTSRKYNGGISASSRLLALIQEEKLSFQPYTTSRCERFPQGMVVVMVAGSIFRNRSYLGTFDQVFEVVGNSRSNNWKIQYVDLKILKSS